MKTYAIAMVKDERDIIRSTVARMMCQVDRVIVADNGSTDGTREILDRFDIDVIDDPEPGYYQSVKMSNLARMAMEDGADFLVPFDADEVWITANCNRRIADVFAELPPEAMIADAAVLDHVAIIGDPCMSEWRRPEVLPLRKVACRAAEGLTIEQGNHGARYEGIRHPLRVSGLLEVRHFPYRSPEQMIRKARNGAAAYAATDLPESVGAHWRGYGNLTDEQITATFNRYFATSDPKADGLVHDPV